MTRSGSAKFFTYKMKKKLVVVFTALCIAFVALAVRLMYIEEVKGDSYERVVLSQQAYDSTSIAYRRGDITDSKGTVLSTSVDVYNLILDASVINSRESYIDPTVSALMECYGASLDEHEIRRILTDKPRSRYNVLLRKMPYDDMRLLYDIMNDGEHPLVKGLWFEKEYIRVYPYGRLADGVIGFTRSDGSGISGLESYYDDYLTGVNGRIYGYLNTDSEYERTVKSAVDGATVVTTLDVNLQSIVEDKIREFIEVYRDNYIEGPGAENIGVIIMNPKNGAVLAMADYPDFDLSDPRNLSEYYTEEELAGMDDEEMYDALNGIWKNFCIASTYEPGSTAKPFTVACGLDTGTLKGDETYVCDGGEHISNYYIRCVNIYGHGTETIKDALMDSCNDALMQMADTIGIDNFTDYQRLFGFGLRTNIDIPGEARTDSLIYTKDNMKGIDLATNSFGQTFNTTMIQLATGFSSIINGGYVYQPYVVSDVIAQGGQTVLHRSSEVLKQTISKNTSDRMREYLYGVVSEGGTGRYAKVNGYSMGGKTGTAQMLPRDGINYLVSFIGYLPQDDPELLIYVVVDRPNTEDQPHSTYAQNIAREILESALSYLNFYPDEEMREDVLSPEVTNMLTGVSAYSERALEVQKSFGGIIPEGDERIRADEFDTEGNPVESEDSGDAENNEGTASEEQGGSQTESSSYEEYSDTGYSEEEQQQPSDEEYAGEEAGEDTSNEEASEVYGEDYENTGEEEAGDIYDENDYDDEAHDTDEEEPELPDDYVETEGFDGLPDEVAGEGEL